jgi:hypothetical protein
VGFFLVLILGPKSEEKAFPIEVSLVSVSLALLRVLFTAFESGNRSGFR